MDLEIDSAIRLLTAAVVGAVVGLPASYRGRFGGIRTHALVAMGAALFCLAGERHVPNDLGRIISGVAAGIGFVGAATVIKRPGYIIGLGTAASIWLAAGLGCLAGLREWRLSLILSGIVTMLNALMLVARIPFSRKPPRDTDVAKKSRGR